MWDTIVHRQAGTYDYLRRRIWSTQRMSRLREKILDLVGDMGTVRLKDGVIDSSIATTILWQTAKASMMTMEDTRGEYQ